MVFGDRPHREAREADKALSEHAAVIAVFPLAIPLMAGPGAIATTLLLSSAAAGVPRMIIVIIIILLVCFICMFCFKLSSLIARTLGRTGNALVQAARDPARSVFGSVHAGWNCCGSNNERLEVSVLNCCRDSNQCHIRRSTVGVRPGLIVARRSHRCDSRDRPGLHKREGPPPAAIRLNCSRR
jgi:hypothetical protein